MSILLLLCLSYIHMNRENCDILLSLPKMLRKEFLWLQTFLFYNLLYIFHVYDKLLFQLWIDELYFFLSFVWGITRMDLEASKIFVLLKCDIEIFVYLSLIKTILLKQLICRQNNQKLIRANPIILWPIRGHTIWYLISFDQLPICL